MQPMSWYTTNAGVGETGAAHGKMKNTHYYLFKKKKQKHWAEATEHPDKPTNIHKQPNKYGQQTPEMLATILEVVVLRFVVVVLLDFNFWETMGFHSTHKNLNLWQRGQQQPRCLLCFPRVLWQTFKRGRGYSIESQRHWVKIPLNLDTKSHSWKGGNNLEGSI